VGSLTNQEIENVQQLELLKLGGLLRAVGEDRTKSAEYKGAVQSYDKALRETVTYPESVRLGKKPSNQDSEMELSRLWSDASVAVSTFDPELANRCFIKGQGWLDPKVWNDDRYKKYGIGIDDMREALMEFNKKQYVQNQQRIPDWFSKAGVGFSTATFLSLFYLLVGPNLALQKRVIFDAWMAFCVAASAAFLGGTAVSKGTLKLPFMKDAPVQFSAVGGIAIFIVVFLMLVSTYR
jgi:hypothetical protein